MTDDKIVEAVARAIDPDCFEDWQRSFDYEVKQSGDHEEARRFADWSSGGKIKQAKIEARAAITAYQLEAWQDISTAPKDFVTDIDIWANGERLTDCCWMRPTYGPKEYAWCRYAYDDCDGPVYNEVRGATHWMPLPPAPKATP